MIGLLDAWLKVTRVTAEPGGVTIANGYLAAGAGRQIPAGEIADVATRITMPAGAIPYYEVTIMRNDGKRVSAGSGVRDKREAEWLATTVKAALGLLLSAALLLGTRDLAAQSGAATPPLQWAVAPSLLLPGAMIAVVSGDPTGPGRSTIELSMPDGYRMPSPFHPTDERVEVKQGTLLIGMGDRFDAGRTLPLIAGDTAVAPAGVHHYSVAKGATVVSVTFIGPYTITYVNAYEAPRQGTFPYGY